MTSYPHFSALAGKRLHLGVSGSVAAYKSLDLVRAFLHAGVSIGATLTKAAREFLTPLSFQALGADPVFTDMFAQDANAEGTVFAHLYPGREARGFVLAPATANSLAKIAHGLADDMLSCQALSFSGSLTLAPAMNTRMWEAPATQRNLASLKEQGHCLVEPDAGLLACGEIGAGRLADLEHIYLHALRTLCSQDLAGKKILITMGPTREPWDAVRYWTNSSSGRMAAAFIQSAWLRGAHVFVVSGPVDVKSLCLPPALPLRQVRTAGEMLLEVLELWPDMDMGIFVAAVADFRPVPFGAEKFKKHTASFPLPIEFVQNPDILETVGRRKAPGQTLVGFAAETTDLHANALAKCRKKNCDLLVANPLGMTDAGFHAETNRVCLFTPNGLVQEWPLLSKADVAWRVFDWLLTI